MQRVMLWTAVALMLALPALAAKPAASSMPPTPATEVQATWQDIQATFGSKPAFFNAFSDTTLPHFWTALKSLQLNPNTAVPPKYKELIGLAVAAQIPCRYCIYFHTEAAKLNGASDQEVKEALGIAGHTRLWSTILNGSQTPDDTFRAEVDKMVTYAQRSAAAGLAPPAVAITDAASVMQDMENLFGVVPTFIKHVPAEVLPSLWKSVKALDFNPNTALPAKYKDLIGIAVDAQIPCKSCLTMDTQFAARLDGVTQREVDEAVAMSALTREASTVLNGSQLDEAQFKRDADKAFAYVRGKLRSMPAGPKSEKTPRK